MNPSRRNVILSSSLALGVGVLAGCGRTPSTPDGSASGSPSSTAAKSDDPGNEVPWKDVTAVSHLFFHSLVMDPQRAFDGDEDAPGYLDYMITIPEFRAIIQQLYERDFILISPHDLYRVDQSGRVSATPPELPRGKKPLVISLDDLSYYEYMADDGFADRLVLADGTVRNEYRDARGTKHTGAYDCVPLLDDFVEQHPDFSHQGTKGVVAVTGYNGVLGYRTSEISYGKENKNIEADRKTARSVADAMKKNGWEFASHSWGHLNFTEEPLWNLKLDNQKWQDEVAPIVGKTDMLIYPFGADIAGPEEYTNEKFRYFASQGFASYFPIDGTVTSWGQITPRYFREARINVDGISLKYAVEGKTDTLQHFFDPASVLDPARPASIAAPLD